MSGHQDRLAGLVVLSAVMTGVPAVAVRGISPTSLTRGVGSAIELLECPAPAGGAVVAARDDVDAAARLEALCSAAGGDRLGLVWILWNGNARAAVHRAAARAGLEAVAAYRSVGTSASPTHLVREGRGHALRWFAASARPRWGPRSRLARLGNFLPLVGHHFLDGRAVLLRPVGGVALACPGEDVAGPGAERGDGGPAAGAKAVPAVVHLGGGATAGRLVLTWADGSGAPTRHTKVAPAHLARHVVAEANALTALTGIAAVTGTVPTLLGVREGSTWAAVTASHLPGRPPRVNPGRAGLGRAIRRVAAEPDVDAMVTAWLATLARASRGRPWPTVRAVAGADRLALAVASLDDPVLQSVIRRGLDLGATSNGLLHGDLWPGNVHCVKAPGGPARITVLDWESAQVGHPLVDLLTWLASSGGRGDGVGPRALVALGGGSSDLRQGAAGSHVSTLLAAMGLTLQPPEVEALVLAQMAVIAVNGGPAGSDGAHEREWLDAVRAVWASWQSTGTSPWSPRPEVSR